MTKDNPELMRKYLESRDNHSVQIVPKEPKYEEVWTCQDGRMLKVDEMTEDHVRATLNMILRNRRQRKALKRDLRRLKDDLRDIDEDDAKWGRS